MHATSNEIPEVITEDYRVRIVHGEFADNKTSYQIVTNVNLLHIFLQPDKSITLNAKEMAFAQVLNCSGITENEQINAQSRINYSLKGEQVNIQANEAGFSFD